MRRTINQGNNPDPDSVGVRALDAHTLEVRLAEPVAYFPFIVTHASHIPAAAGGRSKASGRPGGSPVRSSPTAPYRLVEFDPQHGGVMERNPGYYGDFPGNVEQVEWTVIPDDTELNNAYLENRLDLAFCGIGEGSGYYSPGRNISQPRN